jgi:hypothetical protein
MTQQIDNDEMMTDVIEIALEGTVASVSAAAATLFDSTTQLTESSESSPLMLPQTETRYDDSILWYNLVETKQYQIALTLNNVGISLLENEAYYDAVHTLKKANTIMTYLTTTAVSEDVTADEIIDTNTVSAMSLDKLNTYTRTAYDRLRASQRQKPRRLRRSNSSKRKDELLVHNVFDVTILHDSNISELQTAADEYPTRNSGYVIRIDTTCKYYTSNVIVQTAVIAMNFAIARRCMINIAPSSKQIPAKKIDQSVANTSNHHNQREKFYSERAYKLFTYALSLLQQEANALNSIPVNDYCSNNDSIVSLFHRTISATTIHAIDTPMQQRIDLMIILAVQGLMYMSLDLDLDTEANKYYCALGDLHLSHARCDTSISSPLHNLAPAA